MCSEWDKDRARLWHRQHLARATNTPCDCDWRMHLYVSLVIYLPVKSVKIEIRFAVIYFY